MSDEEHYAAVMVAVAALNNAMMKAVEAGLRVELKESVSREFIGTNRHPFVSANVRVFRELL